ncbi:MAG: D-alanine--D-alanine ligase [Candidatus Omnitrophica bacterium]|nr:D-alanine--D-alanine ligase [Candidatus Omnitrophota bacterium]
MKKDLKNLRIGVFRGGVSSERDISLISGQSVIEALLKRGYKVVDLDLKTKDENEIMKMINRNRVDIAFIALHGQFGEDGGIQRILERNSLPFTGAGSYSSALAMDKIETLKVLKQNNIPVPEYWIEDEGLPLFSDRDFPLVVKPHCAGSSIGVNIVKDVSLLQKALGEAKKYSTRVIVERYIEGRELTAAIVGQEVLPVVEIVFNKELFDFFSKYDDDLTQFIVPAQVPKKVYKLIQDLAYRVYKILACRHFGRIDFRIDKKNNPYVLELNSIPGLTSHSLLPLAAKEAGLTFEGLCERILNQALEEHIAEGFYEESAQKKN